MPAAWAVSTMPVPLGTWTVRSSIVTVTRSVWAGACVMPPACAWFVSVLLPVTAAGQVPSGHGRQRPFHSSGSILWKTPVRGSCGHLRDGGVRVHRDRRQDVVERRAASERAAAVVDVRLELVAELVDVRGDD